MIVSGKSTEDPGRYPPAVTMKRLVMCNACHRRLLPGIRAG
jgi:hypothetical protein